MGNFTLKSFARVWINDKNEISDGFKKHAFTPKIDRRKWVCVLISHSFYYTLCKVGELLRSTLSTQGREVQERRRSEPRGTARRRRVSRAARVRPAARCCACLRQDRSTCGDAALHSPSLAWRPCAQARALVLPVYGVSGSNLTCCRTYAPKQHIAQKFARLAALVLRFVHFAEIAKGG